MFELLIVLFGGLKAYPVDWKSFIKPTNKYVVIFDLKKNVNFFLICNFSLWMRSGQVDSANCQHQVATVLGSIPASSDTDESEGGRWSSVEKST
jgi:hypothetical protein